MRKRIPQIITEEELSKICKARFQMVFHKNPLALFTAIRDVCMLKMIYYNGLRPRECYNAEMRFLDFNAKTFYIPAKSNKQRHQDTIPIQDFMLNILEDYLKIKNKFFPNSKFLFPSTRDQNKPLYRGTFIRNFTQACKKANLLQISYSDKSNHLRCNITLYSLRHSFATLCYKKIKDIRKTAVMLRHRDFMCRSTLIYIHTADRLDKRKILEEVFAERTQIISELAQL